MTDDKKDDKKDAKNPSDDAGALDWEQALSEWENTSFVPEVAKDVATDKPASLAGGSRPLYRPPVFPTGKAQPTLPLLPIWPVDESETGVTRMALVPEELLRDEALAGSSTSRGGLGQLFLRGDEERAPAPPDDLGRTAPPPPPDSSAGVPPRPADHEFTAEALIREDGEDGEEAETRFFRGAAGSPHASGPQLLAPKTRQFDPNDVTMVGEVDSGRRGSSLSELAARRPGREASEGPTPAIATAPLTQTSLWTDERPAREWLAAAAREAMRERTRWLESEARASEDPVARARALLACSEIHAIVGEIEQARALAAEARDLAPSLPLAHWQARSLLPSPDDADYAESLDAETRTTAEGPARVHGMLLAAEALWAAGREEPATLRFEDVAATANGDVRAAVVLAARALGAGDTAAALRFIADGPERAPLADAVARCVRLRDAGDAPAGSADEDSANELLLRLRGALQRRDLAEAAEFAARLAGVPELARGAKWLAASLGATSARGRPQSAGWLHDLAERGDEQARRALMARAIELGDRQRLAEAMSTGGALTSPERVALAIFGGGALSSNDTQLDATAAIAGMAPLAAAATALALPGDGDRDAEVRAHAGRTVGAPNSRALLRLGRLLAASASSASIEEALAAIDEPRPAVVRAVALEMAVRAGRSSEVSGALETWGKGWGDGAEAAAGPIAAALVAERAGDRLRALEAFKAARTADPTHEAALRAIASLEPVDLVAEMNQLADDLGDGLRSAVARIEAVARSEGALPEPTRAHMLAQAHEAAPELPIASFLAERIARRGGDVDEVLRWVRERRARTGDVIEAALDGVREALLVADREPTLAGERLREAHQARPKDIALRQLYERVVSPSAESRAAWREQRASEASGDPRRLLLLEAAHEYEAAGDDQGALRCTEGTGPRDDTLGGIARARAELRMQQVAGLAEELLAVAKGASDVPARREAYERLAALDASARQDPASALLSHRAILELSPEHAPSLRHVEHHLIGEGRVEELEPIATAIANMLRGTGSGECTAHAQLAARLRFRATDARWDATYDVVALAAVEVQPSLWALRMLQAHARSRGDDAALLTTTLQLVDRSSRPAETAALLVHAAESAFRLGRIDDARTLLERATTEDPGDVVAWSLLADVRRRAGDLRGAAEACESLARCSAAREHRLRAWCEAGLIWEGEAKDEDRAVLAFEAASSIDVAYEDVFARLCRLYAARKMQPELASLLERRMSGIADPEERLDMEVRRGRVLLDAGDLDAARRAFEAVLAQRPEHLGALMAIAHLCESQGQWEPAEQALVQLARLLATPEDQREVYRRLGELYWHRMPNLPRAEVALKEVLKRAPGDVDATEKLVDVYRRQNEPARAVEFQQELVGKARSPEEKRKRLVDLAAIHEQTGRDNRRAEQTLEAARREFPQDVGILRALADFYLRHQQSPAVNILLDRVGGDARRALAAGRIAPWLFEILATVFELRGKKDAARVTRCMLAALHGQPADIRGAGERALDPRLDDLLAPEALSPAMRTLLAKAGDALDAASPVDLRSLKAVPLAVQAPLSRLVTRAGGLIGLGGVQLLVSPKLGPVCMAVGSAPPVIVIGESLVDDQRVGPFVVLRALKLVHARASALARSAPADVAVLVSAWLRCFNPTWEPQGVNPITMNALGAKIQAALPRTFDMDVSILALEAAGATQAPTLLAAHTLSWADRAALLALGDMNAALDAIGLAGGRPAAPVDPRERAAWIARTPEARDLIAFAVTDAFAEARARLGMR